MAGMQQVAAKIVWQRINCLIPTISDKGANLIALKSFIQQLYEKIISNKPLIFSNRAKVHIRKMSEKSLDNSFILNTCFHHHY